MTTLSAHRAEPFNLLIDYGIWVALGIAILAAAAMDARLSKRCKHS